MGFVPGKGEVESVWTPSGDPRRPRDDSDTNRVAGVDPEQSRRIGRRPEGEITGDGLRVIMRRIKGVTAPDVLTVDFHFQVPPLDSLGRDTAFAHNDYGTIRHGQLSRPDGVQLGTIQFDTVFVDYDAPWTNLRYPNVTFEGRGEGMRVPHPILLAAELEAISKTGTPFELIIQQARLWGNQADVHWAPKNGNAATLRSVHVEERAGEVDARYVTCAFTEYRSVALMRKKQGKGRGSRDKNRGRDLPTVVVVDGDSTGVTKAGAILTDLTLRKLARYFYGESSAWKRIVSANADVRNIRDFGADRQLSELVIRNHKVQIKLRIPSAGTRKADADAKTAGFITDIDSGDFIGDEVVA